MKSKNEVRKPIEQQRRAHSAEWIDIASRKIVERVLAQPTFREANSVALYMAIAGEVNLDALLELCWTAKKQTAIPIFDAGSKCYQLAAITPETRFITGHYGIREPATTQPINVENIDLFLIPGVAFDEAGNRLGRGGGYYDRLLKNFNGTRMAVAFDFQLAEHIPTDPHDIPMHAILTETKTINVLCNER